MARLIKFSDSAPTAIFNPITNQQVVIIVQKNKEGRGWFYETEDPVLISAAIGKYDWHLVSPEEAVGAPICLDHDSPYLGNGFLFKSIPVESIKAGRVLTQGEVFREQRLAEEAKEAEVKKPETKPEAKAKKEPAAPEPKSEKE